MSTEWKKNTVTNKSTLKFGFKWSQVMELPQKEYPKVIQVNLGNGNLTFCWLNFSVMTQKLRIIYNLVRKKWRVKKINIVIHSGSSVKGNKKKRMEFPDGKEKNNPSSRIRTSDLRMTTFTLQSSALPTELSKGPREYKWKNSLSNYTMCTLTRGKLKQSTDKPSHHKPKHQRTE